MRVAPLDAEDNEYVSIINNFFSFADKGGKKMVSLTFRHKKSDKSRFLYIIHWQVLIYFRFEVFFNCCKVLNRAAASAS